ncbi:kinase [Agrobacterium arsenijevicii]|uniref:Kinase n=1 Tax=Agrobacterium arsenijevicii TaxID=1585697 RepID=A0ABR5D409_9HYPH|nr:kinase [Agrobacterium arsenijevicii]
MPLPGKTSHVTFWPDNGKGIRTRPEGRSKAARAARLALDELGHPGAEGSLTIESAIPHGCGYGSSTADVVASIRAVAAAARAQISRSTICRLAVAAEVATDAIVFEGQAVVFAHRQGVVLEYLPGDYPPLYVVGFASPDDAPVETVEMPPAHYSGTEIETFRMLRGHLRHAIAQQDAHSIARVATASARINQRHLPKRRFDDFLRLAETGGACGVQVAHSGNRMGILLDARDDDSADRAESIARAAQKDGFTDIIRFAVNADGAPTWVLE